MKTKIAFATLAAASLAGAALAGFFGMNLTVDGDAIGADGSRAAMDLKIELDGNVGLRRMGSMTLYSPKGSSLLNFAPHTVEDAKYAGDSAVVRGTGLLSSGRGPTFKAAYRIFAYDGAMSEKGESDKFEIELSGFRGGPIVFSGTMANGDLSLWASK